MSYSTSLNILYNLSSCTHQRLISEIKECKCVRLVGDNFNLKIGTKDERSSRQGKMINYFASVALAYDFNRSTQMPHILMNKPALDRQVNNSHINISQADMQHLSQMYSKIIMKVAARPINFFTLLSYCTQTANKNSFNIKLPEIIPLNVSSHNEQNLSDVTLIMHHYEQLLITCCTKAGIDVNDRHIHIGGDQLTRDIFSSATK